MTCTVNVADRISKSPLIGAFHARYPSLQVAARSRTVPGAMAAIVVAPRAYPHSVSRAATTREAPWSTARENSARARSTGSGRTRWRRRRLAARATTTPSLLRGPLAVPAGALIPPRRPRHTRLLLCEARRRGAIPGALRRRIHRPQVAPEVAGFAPRPQMLLDGCALARFCRSGRPSTHAEPDYLKDASASQVDALEERDTRITSQIIGERRSSARAAVASRLIGCSRCGGAHLAYRSVPAYPRAPCPKGKAPQLLPNTQQHQGIERIRGRC